MKLSLACMLLGSLALAGPAQAQTQPKPKAKARSSVKAAPRTIPSNSPAARAADPLRGTNDNGKGQNGYAAPGEPINVQENGKKTPPYDGPAAGHGTTPKGMTMPRKQ